MNIFNLKTVNMDIACIIIERIVDDSLVYRIYSLMAPFEKEIEHTFQDLTKLRITNVKGRNEYLRPFFGQNRKVGQIVRGITDIVDDPVKSALILSELKALINNEKKEVSNTTKALLADK